MQIICHANEALYATSLANCIVVSIIRHQDYRPELPPNQGALRVRYAKEQEWLDQEQLDAIYRFVERKQRLGHTTVLLGTPNAAARDTVLRILETLP